MSCVIESSEVQGALPMKCLPIPGETLNNGAHIEIYWAHKKLCDVHCLNIIELFNKLYVMLYFIAT
jgi:hypothetical protein